MWDTSLIRTAHQFDLNIVLLIALGCFGFACAVTIHKAIARLEENMSALKDTLDGITAKLTAIDAKVAALVAAAQTDTLAPETQAALDALVSEVNKVGTDAGV